MMRSISVLLAVLLLSLSGCGGDAKPEYGYEQPLSLPGSVRQTWAVAPAVDLSGQRVDPILQADLLYQQIQQTAGLTVIPVNRVVQVYNSLRIVQVQSEEQAALVCDLLGCDALLVPTITAYDPYSPPKVGASLQLFLKGRGYRRPVEIDPRELARRATPPENSPPLRSGFAQAVGMFDAANGSTRAEALRYATGRNDPSGPYKAEGYFVEMDRYCGFVYHSLIEELMSKPQLARE